MGLYLNPPEHALVFCINEKSQIQALDRTQPLLPLRPGQAGAAYPRLPAPWDHLAVCGAGTEDQPSDRSTAPPPPLVEFRQFLDLIETGVPAELDVHLILDNYGTHQTALIRNWFAKRPRFHLHFTPTYASWINLVERWFAESPTSGFDAGFFGV